MPDHPSHPGTPPENAAPAPGLPSRPPEAKPGPAAGAEADHHPHFGTAHLLTNVKRLTISSGFVTLSSQGLQFFINLGSIMVLARLLAPQDFGLVAMVATIMGFVRIFNDAGLSTVTIQSAGITQAQVSNLFWINVALGGLASTLLAALSPAIAWFYKEPRLVGVTLALCINFLLASSTVQHLALLKRQMRFKAVALIETGAMTFGILAGVGMAWRGFGYWSLVGMQMGTAFFGFGSTWLTSTWRPQLPRRRSGTRPLLHFGASLSASSFMWSIARGSDGLLVGRSYGPDSLGLYNRASALLLRPVQQLVGPIESVFVPMLSRLQNEPERYRRTILQALEVIAVASFLFAGLLLAISHPLTLVVLGAQWEGAAPIFAGFTLVALFTPMASVSTWLLTSQGRGKDFLLQSLIGSSATIVAFLIGLPFGPKWVALSYSVTCLVVLLPAQFHIAGRRGPVRTRELWSHSLRHLPVWIGVCGGTYLMQRLVQDQTPRVQLTVCVLAGLTCGAAIVLAYAPSRRAALNLFKVLKESGKFGRGR